jgi:glycosyltransferase involved in cell wall biosynthesis
MRWPSGLYARDQRLPEMKRVLVLANNLKQASYRVRIESLLPLLRDRGFDLDVQLRPRSWLARRALLRSATGYHAVLLQRKLLDPSDARLLRRSARKIFYDIDDAVMYHNRPVSWLSRWRTSRRFLATVRVIDHVVAGNEYLADIFRAHGRAVTVVPTVVDPARYKVKSHRPTDAPRLVWIGSRSTLPYVRQFLPALERAAQAVPGLRLVTVADETIQNASLPVEHIPWSAETEADALVRGDIGIAPTPTDRWTLGKCGFKIVQYMAAGLPVVASPVGANAELVRVGETGYLPERPEEWAAHIVALAKDVALREAMGSAGRELVERKYSLEHVADEWASLLDH